MYDPVKHSIPVLEIQVATENVVNKSDGKTKNKVFNVIGNSMIKNLNSLL